MLAWSPAQHGQLYPLSPTTTSNTPSAVECPKAMNSAGVRSANLLGVPLVSIRTPAAVVPQGVGDSDMKYST